MRKTAVFGIALALILVLLATSVNATTTNSRTICSSIGVNPNCYNLGAGYAWCSKDKVSIDKNNTNGFIIQKSLNTYYLCQNGLLIAKTNVRSTNKVNFMTGIWAGDLTGNKDAKIISNIFYVPDFFVKYLKGDVQFIRGFPPLCGPGC